MTRSLRDRSQRPPTAPLAVARRPAWSSLALAAALALMACDAAADEPACFVPAPSRHTAYVPGDERATPPAERTPGYLHTDGRDIVDHRGRVVRLTGVNWFGLETDNFAPFGLHARSMGSILDQVVRLGFNTLRVPYSNELLDPGARPPDGAIDFDHNPDLRGVTGLDLLDRLVAEAGKRGLKIILDRHTMFARRDVFDPGCEKNGPWYSNTYPERRWIADWKLLAERYRGDTTVIGADLTNEPPGTWGDDVLATDWRLAAERAGNAILAVNPELLIIVEGVTLHDDFSLRGYWAGGNLAGARAAPVRLDLPEQLVYSPHDYPATVAPQPWFEDPEFPLNLEAIWDEAWGYLSDEDIAPIWIGEFGSKLQTAQDRVWLEHLMSYIADRELSFAVWSLNPNSDDTDGLLLEDWRTVRAALHDSVAPHLAPTIP